MLKQRILTAFFMLAVLLLALFYASAQTFAVFTGVLIATAGWEWGRLNGASAVGAVATGAVCFAACAAIWFSGYLSQPLLPLWCVVGGCWVLGSAALLRGGVGGWLGLPQAVRWLAGVVALCVAWAALVEAREIGVVFLLSIMLLVWVADVCAYFAGRTFGLRFTRGKLAPSISPGKSWEGVWGGVLGVLLLSIVWVATDHYFQKEGGSFYALIAARSWLLLPVAVLFMAVMSVAGDLVESLVKRSAGAKDSSNLLPGHGGVLDRVDALLPTLPLAIMLTRLVAL